MVLLFIDHDNVGPDEAVQLIEGARLPNHIDPGTIMSLEESDIGEWSDDHPLNDRGTKEAEFLKLFPDGACRAEPEHSGPCVPMHEPMTADEEAGLRARSHKGCAFAPWEAEYLFTAIDALCAEVAKVTADRDEARRLLIAQELRGMTPRAGSLAAKLRDAEATVAAQAKVIAMLPVRDEALIRSTAEFLCEDRPEEDLRAIVAAVLGAPDVLARISATIAARAALGKDGA